MLATVDSTLQVHNQFLGAILDGIGEHAMLHAAALEDRRGGVLLLAGPEGHGKSSLALELASRGLRFLSDDYAPLNLATGFVSPYPRAVGVLPDGNAPIPEAFRRAARDPSVPRLLGKALLDVGRVLGEEYIATAPGPVKHVILLSSQGSEGEPSSRQTWIEIAARARFGEKIERALLNIDGVEIVERRQKDEVRGWRLRVSHAHGPTQALSRVLESRAVLFVRKSWTRAPGFDATPSAAPVSRRSAAYLLGQEILNRRGRSRFFVRYRKDVVKLVLDLAGSLAQAACWRVTVGDLQKTANLVEKLTTTGI